SFPACGVNLMSGQNNISYSHRRSFIGGSDARIIMGNDEAALTQLWREKRGEVEPEDLSGNLVVHRITLSTRNIFRVISRKFSKTSFRKSKRTLRRCWRPNVPRIPTKLTKSSMRSSAASAWR